MKSTACAPDGGKRAARWDDAAVLTLFKKGESNDGGAGVKESFPSVLRGFSRQFGQETWSGAAHGVPVAENIDSGKAIPNIISIPFEIG